MLRGTISPIYSWGSHSAMRTGDERTAVLRPISVLVCLYTGQLPSSPSSRAHELPSGLQILECLLSGLKRKLASSPAASLVKTQMAFLL